MAANEIHVGDIGTTFEITMYDGDAIVNLSGANTLQMFFLKPDGSTTLTKTATLVTDGTDGKLKYVTVANDLDTAGTWKIQARIQFDASNDWKSDISKFKVFPNII
jgi:hypothetical protein